MIENPLRKYMEYKMYIVLLSILIGFLLGLLYWMFWEEVKHPDQNDPYWRYR